MNSVMLSQSQLNPAQKKNILDQAKPHTNIATWSLAGSKWRQRQPVKYHVEGWWSVKKEVGAGKDYVKFYLQSPSGILCQSGFEICHAEWSALPYLWKIELFFVSNSWCENNSFGFLLNFDMIRKSHFTFSKYTVLVFWFEDTFQKFAYICCKQYNTGTFRITAKCLTRCSVWIGTSFRVLFSFGLFFWVKRKIEAKGLKEKNLCFWALFRLRILCTFQMFMTLRKLFFTLPWADSLLSLSQYMHWSSEMSRGPILLECRIIHWTDEEKNV